jgi:RecB family exonuclease
MSVQVVLTLPDETYHTAERLARLTGRAVTEVLSEAIVGSFGALGPGDDEDTPVGSLADADVLRLTELQMRPAQDRRLSALLEKQQAGTLAEVERPELAALMQMYQVGLLRKAEALREAVARGLIAPLAP